MLLTRTRFKRRVAFAGFAAVLGLGSTLGAVGGVLGSSPASASTTPAPCTNEVTVGIAPTIYEGTTTSTLAPTQTRARVGDEVVYTVSVSQTTSKDCPLQTGTVNLTFPNGTTTTLGTISTPFIPGTAAHDRVIFSSARYVVTNTDIGRHTATLPTSTPATGNIQAFAFTVGATTKKNTGTLQRASGSADYTTPVLHPETTLTKMPSVKSGPIPLTVTYTFTESNVSVDPSTLVYLDALHTVALQDTTGCTPAFTSSSDGTTSTLNPGATWTYTCSVTYTTAGTFTDHVSASGIAGDGRPSGTPTSLGAPATETAEASVTATPATPVIFTTPTPSTAVVGSTLKDEVTLSTLVNPKTGTTAGTITVELFTPSDTTCTGTATFTTVFKAATGNGTYTSPTGYVANVAGTWHWVASYSGDANNNPVASTCTAEAVTVTAPGKTLTPGYWKTHLSYTGAHPTAPYTGDFLPQSLGSYVVSNTTEAFAVLQDLACKTTGINCLAGQLLAAELNIAAFGPATPGITAIVVQANALLTTAGYNGPGTYPKTWAATAKYLAAELSTYNQMFDF